MPASWKSHSNSTPVASNTRLVASASSGPVPSPGMKVTRCVKTSPFLDVRRPMLRGGGGLVRDEVAGAHQREGEHAARERHDRGDDHDLVEPVDEGLARGGMCAWR